MQNILLSTLKMRSVEEELEEEGGGATVLERVEQGATEVQGMSMVMTGAGN
jgi:hypothetical protein